MQLRHGACLLLFLAVTTAQAAPDPVRWSGDSWVADLRSQPPYHAEFMLIFKGARDKRSFGGQDALRWSSEFRQLFWVVSRLPDPT